MNSKNFCAIMMVFLTTAVFAEEGTWRAVDTVSQTVIDNQVVSVDSSMEPLILEINFRTAVIAELLLKNENASQPKWFSATYIEEDGQIVFDIAMYGQIIISREIILKEMFRAAYSSIITADEIMAVGTQPVAVYEQNEIITPTIKELSYEIDMLGVDDQGVARQQELNPDSSESQILIITSMFRRFE